jgi:hypothetical protein
MRDDERHEGWYRVDKLLKGEFVKRSQFGKKVYRRGEYIREAKAYALDHEDDISKWSLVRGSTKVWAGFVY